jgi:cytochrome c biogenesis protein CcmG, thiol:disulfide interchange protein DsbE
MKYFLSMMLILCFFLPALAGDEGSDREKAPDFTLPDLDGKNYVLYQNLEKGPVVINFWATWCVPCIEELKKMKKIYDTYSEKEVSFLAISVDDPKTVGRVKSFARSHRYPFHILLDTNSEVMRMLGGSVPPFTIILDKEGRIVYSHVGYRVGDEKKVEEELDKLLN